MPRFMNCTREMNIDIHIRTFTYEDPFDESYDMTAILHTHIANHKKNVSCSRLAVS